MRINDGTVTEVGTELPSLAGEHVIDAKGGALLPGLHDHHIHLRALAAVQSSIAVGPPAVTDGVALGRRLRDAARRAAPDQWLRGIGYHDSVAGHLDRDALDAMVADRPLRIQHRSGALWVMNSRGLAAARIEQCPLDGVERDAGGRPTGRLWRLDDWLRGVIPPVSSDLGLVSRSAAAAGVTGFTDTTPNRGQIDLDDLTARSADGTIVQRLHLMCPPQLRAGTGPRVTVGPTKVMLDDDRLPTLDELTDTIALAHRSGRPVAVHCVTALQLVLTAAALRLGGHIVGDRIEHGSVVPPDLVGDLRDLGVTVVTQPGFVAERGDDYLQEVDEPERAWLYRCASLLEHGIPVAAGTDAPFAGPDPWAAIRAAIERRTPSGRVLGVSEQVSPVVALGLFLGEAVRPGRARQIRAGRAADLCLLHTPLSVALAAPSASLVAATIVAGEVVADLR